MALFKHRTGTVTLLLTTRLRELASRVGQPCALEPLDEARATSMLARCLQRTEAELAADGAFAQLVRRSCGLPIMLESLANMCDGQAASEVLQELEAARQEQSKLEVPGGGEYEHDDFFGGLEVQLRRLEEKDEPLARRYAMLAVLPEDVKMPLAEARRLWGVGEAVARASARRLKDQHLLKIEVEEESGAQMLSLLDLHLQYLRHRGRHSLAGWHEALLRGCERRTLGDRDQEEDDVYWGEEANVLHHLRGCGWAPGALGGEVTELWLHHQGLGGEDAEGLAAMVAASGSLALKTLWVDSKHAELVAACKSKGVELDELPCTLL